MMIHIDVDLIYLNSVMNYFLHLFSFNMRILDEKRCKTFFAVLENIRLMCFVKAKHIYV
jgi:hypothetical protein